MCIFWEKNKTRNRVEFAGNSFDQYFIVFCISKAYKVFEENGIFLCLNFSIVCDMYDVTVHNATYNGNENLFLEKDYIIYKSWRHYTWLHMLHVIITNKNTLSFRFENLLKLLPTILLYCVLFFFSVFIGLFLCV